MSMLCMPMAALHLVPLGGAADPQANPPRTVMAWF